jgi:hypothetical protein
MFLGRTRATASVILLGQLALRDDAAADQPVQYKVIDFAKHPEAAGVSAILAMSDSSVFFFGIVAGGNSHIFVWDPVRGLHDTIPDASFWVGDISSFNSSGAYLSLYDLDSTPPALPQPPTAFVWSEDRGLRVLPPLPGDYSADPISSTRRERFSASATAPKGAWLPRRCSGTPSKSRTRPDRNMTRISIS